MVFLLKSFAREGEQKVDVALLDLGESLAVAPARGLTTMYSFGATFIGILAKTIVTAP
jgi:hypothetical protein